MQWTGWFDRHFQPAPRGKWAGISDTLWNSWTWQQQHRLRTWADFEACFELTAEEEAVFHACKDRFEVAVTPYYAALMDPQDRACPIRRQGLPAAEELRPHAHQWADPLAEEAQSPVGGLVHRYPDRVLLYTTHNCPVYCRFCTRKRKVGAPESMPHRDAMDAALAYIRQHTDIREVILSGGDPLSLSDDRLADLLHALYRIPHVQMVRIGTRNLVTLPQRVTPDLSSMLGGFPTVQVMTHFNHPQECTRESLEASHLLAQAGVPVYNQMALLKGINDRAETVMRLNHLLQMMKIRPYYMFHCDYSEGISHFQTRIEDDLELVRALEGHTSGVAIPHYAIDLVDGKGKVRLTGQSQMEDGQLYLRNYEGEWVRYGNEGPTGPNENG